MQRLPRAARWVKTYKNIGFAFLTLASSCVLCLPARAASHALIMWIGQYADPRANLPGIELDAKAARQIALTMGVPTDNISELKNGELTLQMMSQAIAGLVNRIAPGDKVFLYYSGHGNQLVNVSGNGRKCSEGMVSYDLQLYFDRNLEADLSKLGSKASQVVMMNDSCFSGGASTKSFSRLVAKALPVPLRKAGAASAAADYNCGDAVNKSLAKNLEVISRGGARLLYIAAAADNEVASASPEGSLATQAWAACLKDPAADTNHSGTINGDELRACAQARIDANKLGVRQHVTLTGTTTFGTRDS